MTGMSLLPVEATLRRALGIPDDARHVILFAESSHWDPNWLHTSEEYYRRWVAPNLDLALDALQRESRRVYSVECCFFLRMYWERQPSKQPLIRQLVNEGRLRMTSSGVTTADTLLPGAEAILRDLLIGQEWLRQNGMAQEPRLAYFTDSFGCTPALPSLLRAAGFDRTAITRIDGMYMMGCDLESARRFPRPGSSAARLLQVEKSLDFMWRDRNGAEVLCHWNAFGYSQGDMLAFRGLARMYLVPLAITDRSEGNVARHIHSYCRQIEPYSRTPYMFCPIGMDFVPPIPDLVALLDRYNRVRYPTTGIWALNAGLDDYLSLVECHRDLLPTVELDPNPYWTGFYTSRPALKERCWALVDRLLLAERLALATGMDDAASAALQEIGAAWWEAATANHHDLITGTSPDAVADVEQVPGLQQAAATVDAAIERLSSLAVQVPSPPAVVMPESAPSSEPGGRATWSRVGNIIRVETPHLQVDLSEERGGAILCARNVQAAGQERLLGALSNDLISYRDSGGLWRMGHEYRGGFLKPDHRASEQRVVLQIEEGGDTRGDTRGDPRGDVQGDALMLTWEAFLDGERIRRSLWFDGHLPVIYGRVEGLAAPGRTLAVSFATGMVADRLAMAQPGGVVVRPRSRVYEPTFWPVQEFVHLQEGVDGRGMALLFRRPGAVACHADGRVECIALRNATHERAFGLVPLPANPATGHERAPYAFDYALLFTAAGDWQVHELPRLARQVASRRWATDGNQALRARTESLVVAEGHGGDVAIVAAKPAWRGEGIVVRLSSYSPPRQPIALSFRGRLIQAACLCDARERDLEPLAVCDGRAYLTMPGSIATVRLLIQ